MRRGAGCTCSGQPQSLVEWLWLDRPVKIGTLAREMARDYTSDCNRMVATKDFSRLA